MQEIIIVGAGPSGLSAAIQIKKENSKIPVTLVEKNTRIGKKILATGNGRCNLSNTSIKDADIILSFFNELGVLTRVEGEGRVYPFSGRALDVVDSFQRALDTYSIELITGYNLTSLEKREGQKEGQKEGQREGQREFYSLKDSNGRELITSKVVMATGGKAGPQYGTIGEGYQILKKLGIKVSKTFPGLTGIELENYPENLKGVRIKGRASLSFRGNKSVVESGEIQFTGHGLSGIVIMNISSFLGIESGDNFEGYEISIDFMEAFKPEEVGNLLLNRSQIKAMKQGQILSSIVPEPLAIELCKRSGIAEKDMQEPAIFLKEESLRELSKNLKEFNFKVKGLRGWKEAQITVGGVPLEELTGSTYESKKFPGLYIVGELVDYNGPCGGYNIHHAVKTGLCAGKDIAAKVEFGK